MGELYEPCALELQLVHTSCTNPVFANKGFVFAYRIVSRETKVSNPDKKVSRETIC